MTWDTLERIKANLAAERIAGAGLAGDVAALCAAIDAGDDSALPILADALEEVGDKRAAGLRLAVGFSPCKVPFGDGWAWWGDVSFPGADVVPLPAFERLKGEKSDDDNGCLYPTRVAAYLDLAEALASE